MDELSNREIEVLLLAATGKTNRDIAHEMYIGTETVKSHLSSVLRKLNLSSRHQIRARLETDSALRNRVLQPAAMSA